MEYHDFQVWKLLESPTMHWDKTQEWQVVAYTTVNDIDVDIC